MEKIFKEKGFGILEATLKINKFNRTPLGARLHQA